MKITVGKLKQLIKEAVGSALTWDDIHAAQNWLTLDGVDPQARKSFFDFMSTLGIDPKLFTSDNGELFADGDRVIVCYDEPNDTVAAIAVFDKQAGQWLDASDVWATLDDHQY